MYLELLFFFTTAALPSISARNGSPASCCLERNLKQVNVKKIISYWRQEEGICPLKAIVFTLTKGKVLCSDPDSNWTKRAMKKVDQEEEKKQTQRLAPDAPQERTGGLLTTTLLPLTSRWPQVSTIVAKLMGKHRADSTKPQRGSKKRIIIIKKKRKNKNKGQKRKIKPTKQPVSNHTSSFIMSSTI